MGGRYKLVKDHTLALVLDIAHVFAEEKSLYKYEPIPMMMMMMMMTYLFPPRGRRNVRLDPPVEQSVK